MGPIISSSSHLVKIHLIILRCEVELTEETSFVAIRVGRQDELKVLKLAEYTEKRYECKL